MSPFTCKAEFYDGEFGFWADGYSTNLIAPIIVSYKIEQILLRRKVIKSLPKERHFFMLPPFPEEVQNSLHVYWTGHLMCYPVRDGVRHTAFANQVPLLCLVAACNVPWERPFFLAPIILDDTFVPVTSCDVWCTAGQL